MTRDPDPTTVHADAAGNGGSPAERLLLDVIDTVRGPLVLLDAELRVTHTNRSFLETFQVTRDETTGQSLFALADGQLDVPALRTLLRERVTIERELVDVDIDHTFARIGRRIMLVNARLVVRGADNPRFTLLAIEDVTERRLAERRLAAQRRELLRSNAALNEFAFVASHDLQEPLRKILSFGERLGTTAGPLLDGVARDYLERMLGAAARMRTLINDVLAYAQVAVHAQSLAQTNLTAVAHDAVADLEAVIADSAALVDIGPLPTIAADSAQMHQLFQNLVGNALKFRRKDVRPHVRVWAEVTADGWCAVSISDDGIGIKPKYQEQIFRMFERLHNRREYEGSGIGLALCRRIAERHGGSIGVASTPGQGTTFTVTLPITQEAAESEP